MMSTIRNLFLLLYLLWPVAPATGQAGALAGEEQAPVVNDAPHPGTGLARAVDGLDLLLREDSRSRDVQERVPHHPASGRRSQTQNHAYVEAVGLVPPIVPPSSLLAERLPYNPNAPPSAR